MALRRVAFTLGIGAVSAAKVWLDGGLRIIAQPGQSYDDGLYLRLAGSILRGEWLGTFDQLTLTKNPFFPIWIAAVHWVHAPLLQAQTVLYVAAGALFARELVRQGMSRPWAFTAFAAYAFNPFVEVRVLREGIYASLLVATIALGASVARNVRERRFRPGSAALLGTAFAAAWLTREEGALLWVTIAILVSPAVVAAARAHPPRAWLPPAAANLAVAGGVIAAALGGTALANLRAYGVFRINDHGTRPYTRALGALYSVEHARPMPYQTVPPNVRAQLYRESPAFGSLLPYLDGRGGSLAQRESWRALTCAIYPTACGDFGGCWFDWAFRLAVSDAGHYRSARDADAFFVRLSDEIAAACGQGRLRCGPMRDTVVPPLRKVTWFSLARVAYWGAEEVLSFPLRDYVYGDTARSECEPVDRVEIEALTGSPVAPCRAGPDTDTRAGGATRRQIASWMGDCYGAMFAPTFIGAGILLFAMLLVAPVRSRVPRHLILELTLLASVTARLGMLAYIEATWFPAFTNWPSYITPLYPLMILFAATVIGEAAPALARVLARHVHPRAAHPPPSGT